MENNNKDTWMDNGFCPISLPPKWTFGNFNNVDFNGSSVSWE